ncbi:MAG: hypothetical protein LBC20_06515, partial [Planctomycetaceae bacterium]|nr:hypothetical protein [Planctomycetaceae bacterium]
HGINRNASYYLETPTVVSYTSLWASWSSAPNEPPTGIRPFEANDVDELILGGTPTGQPFSAGITWTANVTKPPIVGGGQIAFNQLVNGTYLRYIEGISAAVEKACYTNGNYVLDDTFPYSNIVSVQNTLINDDSPGTGELEETSSNFSQPFNKYTAHFSFQTYLIYQPAGNDSKWVTLGVIYWGWNATAVYSQGSWGVTSGTTTGGGTGTTTSILPTWNDNVQGRHGWTTY